MQVKWTIEVIADYRDKSKNEVTSLFVKRSAAKMQAGLHLIADGIKVKVVAFSEDFFAGKTDFDLMLAEHELEEPPQVTAAVTVPEEEVPFSSELLEALGKK